MDSGIVLSVPLAFPIDSTCRWFLFFIAISPIRHDNRVNTGADTASFRGICRGFGLEKLPFSTGLLLLLLRVVLTMRILACF